VRKSVILESFFISCCIWNFLVVFCEFAEDGLLPELDGSPDLAAVEILIFFIFNTFCKLILNLTLFYFFSKTNTFARAYFPATAKCLCRAMHGGVPRGMTWRQPGHWPVTWQGLLRHWSWRGTNAPRPMAWQDLDATLIRLVPIPLVWSTVSIILLYKAKPH